MINKGPSTSGTPRNQGKTPNKMFHELKELSLKLDVRIMDSFYCILDYPRLVDIEATFFIEN
jgi:hypothetical protein